MNFKYTVAYGFHIFKKDIDDAFKEYYQELMEESNENIVHEDVNIMFPERKFFYLLQWSNMYNIFNFKYNVETDMCFIYIYKSLNQSIDFGQCNEWAPYYHDNFSSLNNNFGKEEETNYENTCRNFIDKVFNNNIIYTPIQYYRICSIYSNRRN